MSHILVQVLLLAVFSVVLSVVVSCYRDDDPQDVRRGIPRRALLFGGTVAALAVVSYLLGVTFLAPGEV